MSAAKVLILMLLNCVIGFGFSKFTKYRIRVLQMQQEQEQGLKQKRGEYEQIVDLEEGA
ncbi:hypothetical protein BGZ95_010958, partial [Linnemannia exigua]